MAHARHQQPSRAVADLWLNIKADEAAGAYQLSTSRDARDEPEAFAEWCKCNGTPARVVSAWLGEL